MCPYSTHIICYRKEKGRVVQTKELMTSGGSGTIDGPQRTQDHLNEFQKSVSGGKNAIKSHDDRNEQAHWGRFSVYVCVCACRRVLNASFCFNDLGI